MEMRLSRDWHAGLRFHARKSARLVPQSERIPMQATIGGTLKRHVIETTGLGSNPWDSTEAPAPRRG
jgi:hypothetical protein